MKNKIKSFFKTVFETRRTKIMFCLAVVSFLLLISVTYAWFVSMIELPHSQISTGKLDFVAKAYDDNGQFISTLLGDKEYDPNDPDMDKVNAPLFNIENWSSNSVETRYISIENSGTLDIDFNISFIVNDFTEDLHDDLENLGGFWYRIEQIEPQYLDYSLATYKDGTKLSVGYDPKSAYYDKVISKYLENPIHNVVLCSESCTQDNPCTEHSEFSRNLVTIDHFSKYGSLGVESNNRCIYRLDIGFRKDAIEERYTETKFQISGQIYATQKGAILHPDGVGSVFTVNDENTFKLALENALPGDTIVLGSKINYNGDLILNKCVNITTYGNDLVINGNFVVNFTSKHTFQINMSSGGSIYVQQKGAAGGNFELKVPTSEVVIKGHNYLTNIYVDKKVTINTTSADGTKGIFLTGANICNKEGHPKNIDVESNTRITLDYGASLADIQAKINSTNIEIINYGTIDYIYLTGMSLLDNFPNDPKDIEKPQILIDNYGVINKNILLPIWSTKFISDEHSADYKEGNTRIIREWGAGTTGVVENEGQLFENIHIEDYNMMEVSVYPENPDDINDDTRNRKLIVYYGERPGKDTSLEILLREYFASFLGIDDLNSSQINDLLYNVTNITVYPVEGQIFQQTDLIFIKKGLQGIEYVDLSRINIENNIIKGSAFYGKKSLKEFIIPDTVTTIESSAFAGTSIQKFTMPANLAAWYPTCVENIPYIFFNGLTPVISQRQDILANQRQAYQRYFVDEAVLSSYRSKFNTNSLQHAFYPFAELTDDGNHFVRETSNGYELVYYNGQETDYTCGHLVLKGKEVNITSIGAYAFMHVKNPFTITFEDTVKSINDYAFYNSKVANIIFNNVRYIGNYAFYNCDNITKLNTEKVEEIGEYAFQDCTNLFTAEFPELRIMNYAAFYACSNLVQVKFSKLEVLADQAFYASSSSANNKMRALYFYNDSFENVSYKSFNNSTHNEFKCFVKEELIDEFVATGCVVRNKTYPIGEIFGEYIISRTATVGGTSVYCEVNIGEYIVTGPDDNAKIVSYNKSNVTDDLTIPSRFTYIDEDNQERTKIVKTVASYTFSRLKFDEIVLTFGDDILTIEDYAFAGHYNTGNYNAISGYEVNIKEIRLNNVEEIGVRSFVALRKLVKVDAPKLKVLDQYAFYFCSALEIITTPNVEEIYAYALGACSKLFYIDLPSIKIMNGSGIFASCASLVSISFGENLESFYAPDMISSNTIIKEIIFNSDLSITSSFLHSGFSSNYLHIYFKPEIISTCTVHTTYYRELGYKVGDYYITHTNGVLQFNLGLYVIRDVVFESSRRIDGVTYTETIEGVSICAINKDYDYNDPTYTLPTTLDGKVVIALGLRSYSKFNFNSIDTSNYESGENFELTDNIREIGNYAFYKSGIRISDYKNVELIGNYAFGECINMYIIEAPYVRFLGAGAFSSCTNLISFKGENLVEIKSSPFGYCDKMVQIISDVQKSAGSPGFFDKPLVVFGMSENATITESFSYDYTKCLYTNATIAAQYSKLPQFRSNTNFKLGGQFDYEVYDTDGNLIYTFKCYRYCVKESTDSIEINKLITLHGIGDTYEIPSYLDEFPGKPVTKIGASCFRAKTALNSKSVVFADTITYIGGDAFRDITFEGVLDLKNVVTIENEAFVSCKSHTIIGRKVTTIASHNFENNSNLTSLYLDSYASWSSYAFQNCPNLRYVYSEASITHGSIKYGCTSITFVLNKKVNSASEITMNNWNKFTNVTMYVPYESLQYYKEAFSNTSTYKNYKILPIGTVAQVTNAINGTTDTFVLMVVDGKYNIETQTFEQVFEVASILTSNSYIVIPNEWEYDGDGTTKTLKITKLGKDALNGQNTIKNIILPLYMSTYGENAFSECDTLENIYVQEGNEYFDSDGGVLYTKGFKELICFPTKHDVVDYTLHTNTVSIRSYAFKDCEYLNNVITNDKLAVIGTHAFSGTNLTSITFEFVNAPICTGIEVFDLSNTDVIVYVTNDNKDSFITSPYFAYLQLVVM